jgi:hypothetical protein
MPSLPTCNAPKNRFYHIPSAFQLFTSWHRLRDLTQTSMGRLMDVWWTSGVSVPFPLPPSSAVQGSMALITSASMDGAALHKYCTSSEQGLSWSVNRYRRYRIFVIFVTSATFKVV